jgi:hypothetical protein
MYLMLSVAGHLTIFQTRTRGPWWSTRPAWILLAAVTGTQAVATLVAVYGAGLVTPLGWKYAGIVWGYAFACFLVTDPVKLLAYRVLDAVKADTKPEGKAPPQLASDVKPEPQANAVPKPDDAKPEPEAKVEPKPKPDDAEPQPETETPPGATQPRAKSDVTTLLNRSLGDLLIAGLEKDPEDAGRIIAAAITRAEPSEAGGKPTAPKAKAPDGIEDHPDHTPKPKAPSKPKTPAGPAGKTAK